MIKNFSFIIPAEAEKKSVLIFEYRHFYVLIIALKLAYEKQDNGYRNFFGSFFFITGHGNSGGKIY